MIVAYCSTEKRESMRGEIPSSYHKVFFVSYEAIFKLDIAEVLLAMQHL
jgi:hypothetical protein